MTDNDARAIQTIIGELEFPFIFEKALQFALFRTYGIPSISKLLASTTQLSDPTTSCKRYSDTSILISEFVAHSPTSERSRQAIARMNYIHSVYQKAGKISNGDMLYTLSLFACEPVRWINRYEWRQLESFEVCAIGTFWKSIGDAMGIGYEELGTEWRDGLEWWEDIKAWSEQCERVNMVPADTNHTTAEETTNILLWPVPSALKGTARYILYCLMDERLRRAMIYPDPPALLHKVVDLGLSLRKLTLRYLSIPRPAILRAHYMSSTLSPRGTYSYLKYDAAPYYVRPSLLNRYGPQAWYFWLMGLPVPGDPQYSPGGYKISGMGPERFSGKGEEYMKDHVARLEKTRSGGCIFHA